MRTISCLCVTLLSVTLLAATGGAAEKPSKNDKVAESDTVYHRLVLADGPVAYWRFDTSEGGATQNAAGEGLPGLIAGRVTSAQPGPRSPRYPAFDKQNRAVRFSGSGGSVRIKDPGAKSHLDFTAGDRVTLEAWVNPYAYGEGKNVYIVGKGRTHLTSKTTNQNYALRLRGVGGTLRLSFLFRSTGEQGDWHRWNSDVGIPAGSGWHHVAVSYTFGQPETIRGYIDGRPVAGTWDMGGKTKAAPVVDDDQLWIGSAMGGSANSSFNGLIDEVAIYRKALSAERIALRYRRDGSAPAPTSPLPQVVKSDIPADEVLIEIFEGGPKGGAFQFTPSAAADRYRMQAFGFTELPNKYTTKGLIADRQGSLLFRASAAVELPPGEYKLLVRSRGQSRLKVDGKVVTQTSPQRRGGGAHHRVPELKGLGGEHVRPLPPATQERLASVTLDGRHIISLEAIVGPHGLRKELNELVVAIADTKDGHYYLLAPVEQIAYTDAAWKSYAAAQAEWVVRFNDKRRAAADQGERQYWKRRHELARGLAAEMPPVEVPQSAGDLPAKSPVDHFINAKLQQAGAEPAELTDDYSFLRRVTLDTVGVIPTAAEIQAFMADKSPERRERVIDRLLADPRWADHWVPYWQDVLAENPGILKPTLNNTGPFRWYIYEAFRDNRPMDRFVTELVMMEGSRYGGGPAGFELATQNDAPMAAKAHVLAKAFLAVEMKCARCHDAPYHDVKQRDTFSLAAMLARSSRRLPKTSTVPLEPGGRKPAIEISLQPGDEIKPKWPFGEIAPVDVPDGLLRRPGDDRERLAALITSPHNERFARVIVNRLWKRYLGAGMVEPVDDWQFYAPSHPRLLDFLARELITCGYDLKHVARLILTSHAYQRRVGAGDDTAKGPDNRLFAAPTRRRMTAEQLLDSLFVAVGKDLAAEELNFDPDGRSPASTFLNLGKPKRGWEFASLSNERDRPALSLPAARNITDVLKTFGWRNSRADPLTTRDRTSTVLQPLILANGVVGSRITRLSEDSDITALALKKQPVEQFIKGLYLQVLSRPPQQDEVTMFSELLSDGYTARKVEAVVKTKKVGPRNNVSWSNHLSPEATRIKLELERRIRQGDPPTLRLQPDWRERAEDAVWALVNSPEFLFVP